MNIHMFRCICIYIDRCIYMKRDLVLEVDAVDRLVVGQLLRHQPRPLHHLQKGW